MDLIHLGKPVEGINPLHAEILTLASSRNLLKGSDNFCGPPGMAFNFGKYLAKVMAAPRSSRTKDGGGPLQIASAIGTSQHKLPSQLTALNSTHRVTVRYNKRINLFIVFAQSVFLVHKRHNVLHKPVPLLWRIRTTKSRQQFRHKFLVSNGRIGFALWDKCIPPSRQEETLRR